MNMSTGFHENAEQSLSPELSDELTMALAAGRWWAIMEVSHPISEEPEYWELTSGLWWGTAEARETSCPTSRVFSDASEKAQYPHSSFSDATTKTTKQWRQKKTQEAPMPARSTQGAPVPARSQQVAPVHASSKRGNLTSPLVFSDASEKALLSDATLKTTEQQRKWRQKKPQGAPVAAESPQEAPVAVGSPQEAPVAVGSPQGAPVHKSLHRAPGPAPKVPTGSPHGAPLPDKVPDRRKLNIPEPLKQELLQQQKPQASSLQGTLPYNMSKRPRLKIPEPLRSELLQQKPQVYSVQGAPVPDKSEKLKIPEPLQQKPQASLQGTLPDNISKRQRLKIPEPLRSELLQQKPQVYSVQGAPVPDKSEKLKIPKPLQQKPQASLQGTLPDNISKRQRLKIPEPLRSELLQQKPQVYSVQGAPVPDKTSKREKLKIPESLQQKPQASLQGTLPDNISKRQRLKIPEPLRSELLQQKPQAYSVQGAPVHDKTSKREKVKIPEPLKQEMLQQKPACCAQGATVPDKNPEKRNLKIPELLRKELLQQKPQAKSPQDTPLPDRTPVGVSVHASTPQAVAVPAGSPKGVDMPSRIPKGALVRSGTSQGALVPAGSPKQGEIIRVPKQQKQREQQRQPNIPKGASGSQQEAQENRKMAPQDAPVPVNLSPFIQGTPQGAAVPGRTIKQGKCWIPHHLRQQKPSLFAQSLPGPPMPSQSKRTCPWSTKASEGVCHPPPQNKICVKIDKEIQLSQNQISTSHLDQSSLQPRSELNRKSALDNAGGDQSLLQKMQCLAIKVRDQQLEPGSLKQNPPMPSQSKRPCQGEIIRVPKQQKQREQQRLPNIPKGASGSQQEAQENRKMAAMAPQDAPVPVNLSPFIQGAAVPGRTIKQGKCWIPHHLRQQKPSLFAQSLPGAPMPSQSKRPCPWSTKATEGVCHPPPQNKICVKIDKKVQLSQNQISTSHLDQSSLQPRSQLNRKRALDNAGVDQSPPQKIQRLAIKVRDQQLEPGSLTQNPPMPSQSKRPCPWSKKTSEGVCHPPPQNKICVKIDKKVQLNLKLRSQNQISTSHLDQSSLQPRSQLNRKRALDNAGVDQSPPQKIQRLAIKVRDQQLEPGSLTQNPPIHSQSKRPCPWSTKASEGVCHPPPQNKICVKIDKKVQLSQNQISTSHLDQSSLQPRSQLNRKRALDNAGVDQSPPQKIQRLAIKVRDQQLEPGSLKQKSLFM